MKAAYEQEGAPERGREHLWFEVRRIDGESVDAKLLNTPQLATHLKAGETVRVEPKRVSDWRVILPAGGYGPAGTEAMREAVEAMKKQG